MPQDPVLSVQQRQTGKTLPAYSLHLDVIRGLAALAVLFGHAHLIVTGHTTEQAATQGQSVFTHATGATGLGHAAVVVFFVLSGYLVGGSVIRDLNRDTFSISQYSLRRLVRLWTVFIPALFLGYLLDWISSHRFSQAPTFLRGPFSEGALHPPTFLTLAKFITFLNMIPRLGVLAGGSNVSLWSISYEFWYYLIFPFFALAFLHKRFSVWQKVASLVTGLFCLWFVGGSMSAYFVLWLAGVVAYIVPTVPLLNKSKIAIALLIVQFLTTLYAIRTHAFSTAVSDATIGVSFTLMLYGLLHRAQPAKSGWHSRLAHFLSFPSYTLYANHVPFCVLMAAVCVTLFPQLMEHEHLLLTLVLLLVLPFTGLLYWVFERNTDRVRAFAQKRLAH